MSTSLEEEMLNMVRSRGVGSLDKEIIRGVVKTHRDAIRVCYEEGLKIDPELAGTVMVRFVISGTGSVISASVSSTELNASTVEQCMLDEILTWTFPEPVGGGLINVSYPLAFST